MIASAESTLAARGESHAFSHFTEGPFVASSAAALSMAKSDPQIAHGTYEQRLLHVPALYVMALWLHEQNGKNDLMIPLAPTPRGVPSGRPVPVAELLGQLADLAQRTPVEPPDSAKGS